MKDTNVNKYSSHKYSGGRSDWSAVIAGGLNSSGCDGHGTLFFCNDTLSQGAFNEVGSPTLLEFVWTITHSALPTGTDQAAIKVLFDDSSGKNLGITSVTSGGAHGSLSV
jgi:hypothetical protein